MCQGLVLPAGGCKSKLGCLDLDWHPMKLNSLVFLVHSACVLAQQLMVGESTSGV